MSKSAAQIITIMRHVTGREDNTDPQFSDTVMLGYVNDFYQLIMGQEVRLFELNTWYEFTLTANDDEYVIDLSAIGDSILRPPAYVGGYQVEWLQSPQAFYSVWPQTQTYQPTRPQYILYYNNRLLFRAPPDDDYAVKIAAYKINATMPSTNTNITEDYWWRYVAYGAAIDLLTDYNELDRVTQLMPLFERYKSIVYARTMTQLSNQRTYPTF